MPVEIDAEARLAEERKGAAGDEVLDRREARIGGVAEAVMVRDRGAGAARRGADRHPHRVDALARLLDDAVGEEVDLVLVVARAAFEPVGGDSRA